MDRSCHLLTLCGVLATLALGGCQSPYHSDRGALFGGLLGAGTGAIIGDAVGDAGAGAAIGAGVGALGGAAVGAAQPGSASVACAEVVAEQSKSLHRILENPWLVLGVLFLVAGPLGLPLLWRSPRFNLFWKSTLSIVVTV